VDIWGWELDGQFVATRQLSFDFSMGITQYNLKDILANGPVPATLVEERGAAHGFSKIQIRYARRQMKIISFKGPGKDGRWFWVLPHDNRAIPAQRATPNTAYL